MKDLAPLIERAFDLDFDERSYAIEAIDGEIPTFLRGTYYGNGPGRFGRGDVRYRHWLDGDGMVVSLRFTDDGVVFTNRFVQSTKYVTEEKAGRAVFRAFGTAFEGDQLKRGIGIESPVNLNVGPFGGNLLAFGEQGLPWALDPVTLETRGEHDFGGRLNTISPFSAHPCVDQGELYNFGISFSARQPNLQIYRFSPDGELKLRKRLPLDQPSSIHDFTLSASTMVFYLSPHVLDVQAVMDGGRSVMDALEWQPERGSKLMFVCRESGERRGLVEVGKGYCLHLINSFEEDGRVCVDLVEFPEPIYHNYQVLPDLFTHVKSGRPVRYVVDQETWEVVDKLEIDYTLMMDFPQIDPRRATKSYRDLWLLGISKAGQTGRKFFDQLIHLDWENPHAADIYRVPAHCYLGGEPVFVPDPEDQRQGVVICKMFDAEKVEDAYLLFDACDVARGPIARLPLCEALPSCFHACFDPAQEADTKR